MMNDDVLPRGGGDRGQGLVEYVLILALISLATIAALGFLSGKIQTVFSKSGNSLNSISVSSGPGSPPPPAPPPNNAQITSSNSSGIVNANLARFFSAGAIQQCWPETGGNLTACFFGAGTWITISSPGVYYPLPFGGWGTPCAFTWNATGYTFSGTWVAFGGGVHFYRVGASGGPNFGAACT